MRQPSRSYERLLEIRRRLLTDDHPIPQGATPELASNLRAQRKYAAAQPFDEKVLEIRRRLLTDEIDTASTDGVELSRPGG